jgi:hypothetical protein
VPSGTAARLSTPMAASPTPGHNPPAVHTCAALWTTEPRTRVVTLTQFAPSNLDSRFLVPVAVTLPESYFVRAPINGTLYPSSMLYTDFACFFLPPSLRFPILFKATRAYGYLSASRERLLSGIQSDTSVVAAEISSAAASVAESPVPTSKLIQNGQRERARTPGGRAVARICRRRDPRAPRCTRASANNYNNFFFKTNLENRNQ